MIEKNKKPWEIFDAPSPKMGNAKLTHISLFSGCGGFDLGFHQSGFKTIFANDINEDAIETYRHNIGNIFPGDIREIQIPEYSKRPDVLTAGFPCQPFSNAGSRKGLQDGRGTLYQSALDVVNKTKPRAVIHAGNSLTWSQVIIEITGGQTIHLKAPSQDGVYAFSKRNQLGPEHPLGILMALAAKGEWRNPPSSSPDYERVSKAFQRLQTLIQTLVPLPGKPFKKSAGAFVPLFQPRIHPRLRDGEM